MKYQIANSAAAIASTIHVKYFRANLEPESASTTRNRAPIAPSTTIDIDASQARFSHLKSKLRLRAESIAQTGTIDLDQAIGVQGLGFKSASWSPVAAGKVDCLYDNEETPGRNPMIYKKILIATDGSELAGRAVAHGLTLAKELKAPVVVVTVTPMWSALEIAHEARIAKANPIERYEESAAAWAQRILDEAGEQAKAAGVSFEPIYVPESAPAEGIIATAEKQGCDLIVMASHGRRGLGRLVLGSQANEVLAYSKVPALIVR